MSESFEKGDEGTEGEGIVFEEDSGERISADLGEVGEKSKDEGEPKKEEGSDFTIDSEIDLLAGEAEDDGGGDEDQAGEGESKHGDLRDHPRFKTLHRQAKEAKRLLATEQQGHAETKKTLEEYETALTGWEHLFGEYEEPLAAASNFIAFARAADNLAKRDPEIRRILSEVFEDARQGRRSESIFGVERRGGRVKSDGKGEGNVGDESSKRALKDRAERAEDLIDSVLRENGVPKKERTALLREAVRIVDLDGKITRASMAETIKEAATNLEWDLKEVIQRKAVPKRPPTGSPRGASIRRERLASSESGDGKGKEKDKAPETPQEGERKRASIFAGLLRSAVRSQPSGG